MITRPKTLQPVMRAELHLKPKAVEANQERSSLHQFSRPQCRAQIEIGHIHAVWALQRQKVPQLESTRHFVIPQ